MPEIRQPTSILCGTPGGSTRSSSSSRRLPTACPSKRLGAGLDDSVPTACRPLSASAARVLMDQLRSIVVALLIAATAISSRSGMFSKRARSGVLVINTLIGFAMELCPTCHGGHSRARCADRVRCPRRPPSDHSRRRPGARRCRRSRWRPRVPADVRIIDATDLRMNEATLTGESLRCRRRRTRSCRMKRPWQIAATWPTKARPSRPASGAASSSPLEPARKLVVSVLSLQTSMPSRLS